MNWIFPAFALLITLAPGAEVSDAFATWRTNSGELLRFENDGSAARWKVGKDDIKRGKWQADPFAGPVKRFAIDFDDGGKIEVEMAKDGSVVRWGGEVGVKVEEMTAYLRSNDSGGFFVNGSIVARLPTDGGKVNIYIKKGDILSIELQANDEGVGFAAEIFSGNESAISSTDFQYSTAPAPDWATSSSLVGFRSPALMKLRDFALGSVKEPNAAIPQKPDSGFKKIFFKYLVR